MTKKLNPGLTSSPDNYFNDDMSWMYLKQTS